MPARYIKQNLNLPKNTGAYQTKNMGVRVYGTNRNYVHKKSRNGVIIGADLSWEDCVDIQKLFRMGCKKKNLSQRYNISRYYLNKVLSIPLPKDLL